MLRWKVDVRLAAEVAPTGLPDHALLQGGHPWPVISLPDFARPARMVSSLGAGLEISLGAGPAPPSALPPISNLFSSAPLPPHHPFSDRFPAATARPFFPLISEWLHVARPAGLASHNEMRRVGHAWAPICHHVVAAVADPAVGSLPHTITVLLTVDFF